MITSLKEIERAREKVLRRQKLLTTAVNEYMEITDKALEEAKAEAMSRPIKVIEAARLLGVSKPTVYNRGANHCDTYAELWRWTKKNMPDKLKTLEQNYNKILREKKLADK